MMRYFFDLSDGSQVRDDIGSEFRDEDAAQREAIRYAGEVLKFEPDRLEHGSMEVNVSNEDGDVVLSVVVRLRRPGINPAIEPEAT